MWYDQGEAPAFVVDDFKGTFAVSQPKGFEIAVSAGCDKTVRPIYVFFLLTEECSSANEFSTLCILFSMSLVHLKTSWLPQLKFEFLTNLQAHGKL